MKYTAAIYGHSDDIVCLEIWENTPRVKKFYEDELGAKKSFRFNDLFTLNVNHGDKGWEFTFTDVNEDISQLDSTPKFSSRLEISSNGYSPQFVFQCDHLEIKGIWGGKDVILKRHLMNFRDVDEMSDEDYNALVDAMKKDGLLNL